MINIGLAGVGYLGVRHLKHLSTLEDVKVSGILDTDCQRLDEISKEFQVPVASSLDDLISKSDGVVVVTPTSTHFEVGSEVLNAGKPLFLEKPICASVAEGEALMKLATEKNLPVQVGHIERFNRAFRALNGIKLKPRFLEVHRLSSWQPRGGDVAVVFDLMIHDLDLLLTLSNGEPVEVFANGVGVITDSIDIATARIHFSDGMVANVTASRISLKKMRKLRLFGEREYVALDLAEGKCEYVGATDGIDEQVPELALPLGVMEIGDRHREVYHKFLKAEEGDALRLELTAFRDVIAGVAPPPVSGEDGLRALKLAERITDLIKG